MRTDDIIEVRTSLEEKFKDVMDTSEMTEKYNAISFMAPFVYVQRKSDGVKGYLQFTHMPRFYFNWSEE